MDDNNDRFVENKPKLTGRRQRSEPDWRLRQQERRPRRVL